jgi:hypothetical protein
LQSIFRTLLGDSPSQSQLPFFALTTADVFRNAINWKHYTAANRRLQEVLGEILDTHGQQESGADVEWTYQKIWDCLKDRLARLRRAPISIWLDELC